MKTLRFSGMVLLAIVMCVNVTSYSDDENESVPVEKSLIGSWSFRADELLDDSETFWEGQLEFKNNGTCVYSDGQIFDDGEKFIEGKYYFDGN